MKNCRTSMEEKTAYLQKNCDRFMTDLILQLLMNKPANVVKFVHEYTGKLLKNETILKPDLHQEDELRRSLPTFVYPTNEANKVQAQQYCKTENIDYSRKEIEYSRKEIESSRKETESSRKEVDYSRKEVDYSQREPNHFASQIVISTPKNDNNLEQNSGYKSTRNDVYNSEPRLTENSKNLSDNLSNDGVENTTEQINKRNTILEFHKKLSELVLAFRRTEDLNAQDEANLAHFFALPNYTSLEPEKNVSWVTKPAKMKTFDEAKDVLVRIARYPDGTEWDLPISTNDGSVYGKTGWVHNGNKKDPNIKDYAIREINDTKSQMGLIHCHGCELSWPFINKSRAYSIQRLTQKKIPEFDIFIDSSFARPDAKNFIIDKMNDQSDNGAPCNTFTEKLLFKEEGKKNLVFFIRFTGKHKERQSGLFEEGGFLVNRPYCLRCLQDICIKKLCPLKFDSIKKIINESNNYFQMLRNNFTEDNSVVLSVSPMDK